jgi:aminopeptidase N
MRTIAALILAAAFVSTAVSQEPVPVHQTRERTFHVIHYKLDLTLNEQARLLAGDALIRLVPLRPLTDEINLDAANLQVREVLLDTLSLQFRNSGDSLQIQLPKPAGLTDTMALRVKYSVSSPARGLFFVAPDSGYPNKHLQVWTQGEPEDNHYWFPCYDFPNDFSTSEILFTTNDRSTVISNGKLLGVARHPQEHTATWHWYEGRPHASYLISFIAGTYVEVADSARGVHISNYVYPSQRSIAMLSFAKTPEMIRYFADRTGMPYPWEKYSQTVVEDFIFGGEENVSATTLTDATIHDERAHRDGNSDGLVAHELAHQWWGDLLTCRDWSHAWLNEGFATYFQNLFTEHDLGREEAARELYEAQNLVRNADAAHHRRPMVCNSYVRPIDLFDSKIYQKGAVVLNMLRVMLGDELFWKSIRYYIQRNAGRNVETNDFKIAVEEVTGYNLKWFFDEWIYGAGYPEFNVEQSWDQHTRQVRLIVTQTQTIDSLTGIFRVPLDIEVWVHGESGVYPVTIEGVCDTFEFPAYQEPQCVIFDRGSTLLKKVRFEKKPSDWIFQLRHASEAVDRFSAIEELRWVAVSDSASAALAGAALNDNFWAVRQDAAYALGDSHKSSVDSTLVSVYGDRDPRVRTAAVLGLGNYSSPYILQTLLHAWKSDSSDAVANGALRSLIAVDTAGRDNLIREALRRTSRGSIIQSTAMSALAETASDSALTEILRFTLYGTERNLRIHAINLLASQWKKRDDVCSAICRLLNDPSLTVKRVAARALGSMGNTLALAPLRQAQEHAADGRLAREIREAVESISSATQK